MSTRPHRVGGLLGVAHVVLVFAGFALYVQYANPDGTLVERYVESDGLRVYAGLYIEGAAYLLFLPFAAVLARVLRERGAPAAAADLLLPVAAVYCATTITPGLAAFGAATQIGHDGPAGTAQLAALDQLRLFSYYGSLMSLAVFLLAVSVACLGSRALPRWCGWSALLLGLGLTAGVAAADAGGQELPALLSLLWVLAASVWLLRLPAGSAYDEDVPHRVNGTVHDVALAEARSAR